jgi:hypothetical protein
MTAIPPESAVMASGEQSRNVAGHLYMQTNERDNSVVHYVRAVDGRITEVERRASGGSGAGPLNYRSNPGGLLAEGAHSVILSPDRRILFVTNVGDNSVSSLGLSDDGGMTLLDCKPTGHTVTGNLGTAKSLAYAASCGTLYVLHTLGPDNIRLLSVDDAGRLTARPESYVAVPPDKPGRLTTMVVVSPDDQFLLVGSSIDKLPSVNPDGSPRPSGPGQPGGVSPDDRSSSLRRRAEEGRGADRLDPQDLTCRPTARPAHHGGTATARRRSRRLLRVRIPLLRRDHEPLLGIGGAAMTRIRVERFGPSG